MCGDEYADVHEKRNASHYGIAQELAEKCRERGSFMLTYLLGGGGVSREAKCFKSVLLEAHFPPTDTSAARGTSCFGAFAPASGILILNHLTYSIPYFGRFCKP